MNNTFSWRSETWWRLVQNPEGSSWCCRLLFECPLISLLTTLLPMYHIISVSWSLPMPFIHMAANMVVSLTGSHTDRTVIIRWSRCCWLDHRSALPNALLVLPQQLMCKMLNSPEFQISIWICFQFQTTPLSISKMWLLIKVNFPALLQNWKNTFRLHCPLEDS